MDRNKCQMCNFVGQTVTILLKHVLRIHQNDPLFKIACKYNDCQATFRKWDSFRRHVYRTHPNVNVNMQEHLQQDENLNIDDNPYAVYQKLVEVVKRRRWHTASFLINVRKTCKTSQVAIDTVVSGVVGLISVHSGIVLDEIRRVTDPVNNNVNINDVERILLNSANVETIFPNVHTKYLLTKLLEQDCNMVSAEKLFMGHTPKWVYKEEIPDALLIEDCAFYVPFLQQLNQLLMNNEIRAQIQNVQINPVGVYKTALDGSYYKEHIAVNNENRIAIKFYLDE